MNSKKKAVELLNNIGYECEYDSEKDDIHIWKQASPFFKLMYFDTNIKAEHDPKFELNIGTMNLDFESQKAHIKRLNSLIEVLDKIKELDEIRVL